MHINDLLKVASERKASDLHLKVGSHPVIRIAGELVPLVDGAERWCSGALANSPSGDSAARLLDAT